MHADIERSIETKRRRRAEEQFEQRRRQDEKTRDERERAEDLNDAIAIAYVSDSLISDQLSRIAALQEAVIVALTENQERLEQAQQELNEIQAGAHVLPDGRRVYRTKDGSEVRDEAGAAVDPLVISPGEISLVRPTAEQYETKAAEIERLREERQALFEYQETLDQAEERLSEGEISQAEFDKLKSDLESSMPIALRKQMLAEQSKTANLETPDLKANFRPVAAPVVAQTAPDTPNMEMPDLA